MIANKLGKYVINMCLKESQTIELKKSLVQFDGAFRSVCTFMNHKGGLVYFGVDNKDKVFGMQVSDKTLRKISQRIHSRIKPEITAEIKEIAKEDKMLIEVEIPVGNNKPYFLNGKDYKRNATEDKVISPDELENLILEQKVFK